MKTIEDILKMIERFYANKHVYEKAKPYIEYMEKWRKENGYTPQ